ncbi:MAG: AbrB/MazE/SpoVT family DNA-binding domain-containing protein [Candidatus Aenigmarchaeota archaeon]|nr:AbrB/MazE/SpoVT family DNA-binding domain-containing protein [Candidatus Aenigmarchaeota archaeon]
MGISKVDEKRRIVLPKDIVEKFGDEFVIFSAGNDVILKPVPKDPLAALMEEGKKLKGVGWKQIRRDFEKELLERSSKGKRRN